jgi:hypothetical protein
LALLQEIEHWSLATLRYPDRIMPQVFGHAGHFQRKVKGRRGRPISPCILSGNPNFTFNAMAAPPLDRQFFP